MLIKNLKIPSDIQLFFARINKKRFFLVTSCNTQVKLFVKVPSFLAISSTSEGFLSLKVLAIEHQPEFKGFINSFANTINSFRVPYKKTLILKGLGLKASQNDNKIKLRLGHSHESLLSFEERKIKLLVGRSFISVLGHNKVYAGNFSEKIYRLKKANSYKGRGLYYKLKAPILKTVKKT